MNTPLSPNDAIRFNSLEGTLRARLSHQEGTCAKLQALVDLAQAAASLDGVEEDAFNDLDRTKREASLALKAKDETELALAALSVTDGIPGRVRGALLQLGEGSEAECTAYAARWSSFLFLGELYLCLLALAKVLTLFQQSKPRVDERLPPPSPSRQAPPLRSSFVMGCSAP